MVVVGLMHWTLGCVGQRTEIIGLERKEHVRVSVGSIRGFDYMLDGVVGIGVLVMDKVADCRRASLDWGLL